ncbi:MAG: ABC transporter substrate-binding protein [Chloroflexi bacterium]|nr:ABC transporter substrate-binding protein [Chloroflexota bacterium]MCH7656136.1 ABC transporter substrate-binding protein [Chloroflexota bacterium]
MAKKLRLESTAPFQGLPELVAYDEGLFAAEGLDIEFVRRGENAPTAVDRSMTNPEMANSFASHGSAAEQGGAAMFNACEWGNYRRVEDSQTGSRQVGRRAIIVFGALMVAPGSDVYTPQQLANKLVGVPYFAGTHYLAILALEGFLPRDAIKTCLAPSGSRLRFEALMNGEMDATTLTEPYITVAERAGCRIIVAAPYHGTEVAGAEMDGETYASFNKAVREAVRRINADKRKYLQYFIDRHDSDPAVAALTVDDLSPSRLQVVDPAPIPAEELQRTYDWMRSWGMLNSVDVADLVDNQLQLAAHGS